MGDIPRNAPCPCGSGRKYKHCCLATEETGPLRLLPPAELPEFVTLDDEEDGFEDEAWFDDEHWFDDERDLSLYDEIDGVHYDAHRGPKGGDWEGLDRTDQILVVAAYHERCGQGPGEGTGGHLHCHLHAVVETLLLRGRPPEVKQTLVRLLRDGVDRHDAIHALADAYVGSATADDPGPAFLQALADLDPEDWRTDDERFDEDGLDELDYDPELLEDLEPYDEIDGFGYDADQAPDPVRWSALSHEAQRLLVAAYHRRTQQEPEDEAERVDHGIAHVAAESQLARPDFEEPQEVVERFERAGVGRHAAVHAIGETFLRFLQTCLTDDESEALEQYPAALRDLDPAAWGERDGEDPPTG